jgi:hypothetical protein
MRVAPHDEVISISWNFSREPWETRLRIFRLCLGTLLLSRVLYTITAYNTVVREP